METKIFTEDIDVVLKALLPEKTGVFYNAKYSSSFMKEDDGEDRFKYSKYTYVNLRDTTGKPLNGFEFILDFKNSLKSKNHKSIRFSFINNPDGSIRWIYPESNNFPGFLSFYSGSTFKANLYKAIVKNVFRVGLKKTIRSGTFTLLYKEAINPIIMDIMKEGKKYSIFTGTIGVSRKIQIEVNDGQKTEYFIKLPYSEYSKELILREKRNLVSINMQKTEVMNVPVLMLKEEKQAMFTKNIRKKEGVNSVKFSNLHLRALDELYQSTIHQTPINTLKCFEESKKNIEWLKAQKDYKFDRRLLQLMDKSLERLDSGSIIPVTRAHKDFTPWNMFLGKGKLYVFDWESSERNIPMLYDFFHFYFQTGILIQRKSFHEILSMIQQQTKEPEMQSMILKYGINIELHLSFYLIINISEYLVLYQKQQKLHTQVQWLTKSWREAIQYVSAFQNRKDIRKYFVQDFVSEMANIDYVWLKYEGKKLETLSEETDIDLLISKNELPRIMEYMRMYEPFGKMKVVQKSNMTTIQLYFHNQDFLSIDLIYEFKRNSYWYLDPKKILQNYCLNKEGIKVPQRHHDFEYILLFYTLNKSEIPNKYVTQFGTLLPDEKKGILQYINDKYKCNIVSLDDLMLYNRTQETKLSDRIKSDIPMNRSVRFIKNMYLYISDLLKEAIYNKGFVMTISGVDGAGKSTVIESLKDKFEKKYRKKVKVLRHRPSLFPILSSYVYGKKEAEKKSASTLPRQGNNKNLISSLIRFGYYFIDYQIGQIYVFFRYVSRGYIVIYDRYYFDFIQDSKRTNINLPSSLTGFFYRFIYKPKLNVLLYAEPEVILKRKQELTEKEISEMTFLYRKLFNKLSLRYESDTYLMIENIHKDSTIKRILQDYCKVA